MCCLDTICDAPVENYYRPAHSAQPRIIHKQTLSFFNEKTNEQNEKRIIHIAALHAKPVFFIFFVFLIVRHDLSLVFARSRAKL